MVHIVIKTIGREKYVYLQESIHIRGTSKDKITRHVAYLGKLSRFTKQQLIDIVKEYNDKRRQAEWKSA